MRKFLPRFSLYLSITFCSFSFSTIAAVSLSGEITQGGLVIGKTQVNSDVTLDGKPIKVSGNGNFAFGFGRDDTKKHTLIVKTPDGKTEIRELTPSKREYNIQRINGIAKKIMNPNPASVKRSRSDNVKIGAARKDASDLTSFSNGFIAPIQGRITGIYGSQRVFNGQPKRPHFGLDYAGKVGDPVKSPAAGTVTLFEPDMFYSGGTMIIDHGHGVTSTFLHLSKSHVKVGQKVKQGELVAAVGKSGRVTGPHLDWRVNWFSTRLDPALVLKVDALK